MRRTVHRVAFSLVLLLGSVLVVVVLTGMLATPVVAVPHRPASHHPALPLLPQSTTPSAPVTEVHTVTVDGVARTYRTIVPAQPAGKLPLLVVLHGRGQSEASVLNMTGFIGLAQQREAVLLLPDGQQRSWNAGHGCCGFAGAHQTPDVPFVAAIVADALRRWPIDAQRVYLVGYSNGGKLAYSAVCAHAALFAAVATYGAAPLSPCAPGTPAVSVLLAAGTADQVLPFHGKPAGHPPLPSLAQALTWLRETWPYDQARVALSGSDGFLLMPRSKNFFELPHISEPIDYNRHVAPMITDLGAMLATAALVRKIGARDEALD